MLRTSQGPRPLLPWVSPAQMDLSGHSNAIDWPKVSAYFFAQGKFTVKLSAAALKGAVALAVDALPYPVKKGANLDFGRYAPVTVTLSGNEAIGQTAIGVTALTGPIPNGAILTSGVGEFMKLTAAAVAGDVSLTVEALEVAWEAADTAVFDGGGINAEVTADADAGATALVVEPLPFAIADNAEAIADSTGSSDGRMIPAGTVMCRVPSTELLLPRRDRSASEEAVGFLVSDAHEFSVSDAKTGYGLVIGGTEIYENLCPDADGAGDLPAAYKSELAANTHGFIFVDWTDTRV